MVTSAIEPARLRQKIIIVSPLTSGTIFDDVWLCISMCEVEIMMTLTETAAYFCLRDNIGEHDDFPALQDAHLQTSDNSEHTWFR